MNISIIEFVNQANSIDKGKFSIEDHISYIDLEVFMDKEYDLSNGNDQYDMAANSLIEDHFNTLVNSDAVFINYVGNDSDKFFGLILAHHIRLDRVLRKLAILITGAEDKSSLMEYEPDLSHLIHTGGTGYFSNIEEAISNIQKLRSKISLLKITPSTFKGGILDKLVVRQPEEQQGRHGIANQWGAYRMAQVGDLNINYKFPSTLYFKYLLAQSNNPDSKTITFPSVSKILFIDDNHHKGWKDCLEQLFGKGKIVARKSWEEVVEEQITAQIKQDEFDLIILDLYFGENKDINREEGKDILKLIKGSKEKNETTIKGLNPVVPVIMFTASNKAWNMDELYELGADGYYVKEHPETAHDKEFSIKNFEIFYKTVSSCLKKGTLLRGYWRKIQEMKDDSISIIKNKSNNNGDVLIHKERINERLTMFLGLLKKAFEQTYFDKNAFFYSEWELAFLTLWSTLNEIQEASYTKEISKFNIFWNNNAKSYFPLKKRNSKDAEYISRWYIINQTRDVFFEKINVSLKLDKSGGFRSDSNGEYMYSHNTNCYLTYNHQISPYYSSRDIKGRYQKSKIFQPEQKLSFQIAFLLLEKDELKNSTNNKTYLRNLKLLNDFRNHLYLTHGEDSTNADFTKLYEDQRKLDSDSNQSDLKWQKKIEQLFEIVYFLCTGEECKWHEPQ